MYIWLLRSRGEVFHRHAQNQGCGIVAHNYYLRDNLGSRSPHLLRPYVAPSLVKDAPRKFVPRSERIVWFNPKVRPEVVQSTRKLCSSTLLNCTAKMLGDSRGTNFLQPTIKVWLCLRLVGKGRNVWYWKLRYTEISLSLQIVSVQKMNGTFQCHDETFCHKGT